MNDRSSMSSSTPASASASSSNGGGGQRTTISGLLALKRLSDRTDLPGAPTPPFHSYSPSPAAATSDHKPSHRPSPYSLSALHANPSAWLAPAPASYYTGSGALTGPPLATMPAFDTPTPPHPHTAPSAPNLRLGYYTTTAMHMQMQLQMHAHAAAAAAHAARAAHAAAAAHVAAVSMSATAGTLPPPLPSPVPKPTSTSAPSTTTSSSLKRSVSSTTVSSSTSSMTSSSLESSPLAPPPKRARKTHNATITACVHCRDRHLACESNRPCKRCVAAGRADTCVDAERKRKPEPSNNGMLGLDTESAVRAQAAEVEAIKKRVAEEKAERKRQLRKEARLRKKEAAAEALRKVFPTAHKRGETPAAKPAPPPPPPPAVVPPATLPDLAQVMVQDDLAAAFAQVMQQPATGTGPANPAPLADPLAAAPAFPPSSTTLPLPDLPTAPLPASVDLSTSLPSIPDLVSLLNSTTTFPPPQRGQPSSSGASAGSTTASSLPSLLDPDLTESQLVQLLSAPTSPTRGVHGPPGSPTSYALPNLCDLDLDQILAGTSAPATSQSSSSTVVAGLDDATSDGVFPLMPSDTLDFAAYLRQLDLEIDGLQGPFLPADQVALSDLEEDAAATDDDLGGDDTMNDGTGHSSLKSMLEASLASPATKRKTGKKSKSSGSARKRRAKHSEREEVPVLDPQDLAHVIEEQVIGPEDLQPGDVVVEEDPNEDPLFAAFRALAEFAGKHG